MAYMPTINHITKLLIGFCTLCILALSMNASHAIQVYKSIGAYGETNYSQHPPQNGKNVEIIEFRSDGRQNDAGQLAGKTEADQNDNGQNPE